MASSAGFCIFYDWVEVLNDLDPADAMAIIRAISEYKQTGADPVENVPKQVRPVMRMMYQQIKRSEQTSEARAKAGKASAEKRFAEVCLNNVEQNSTSVEQESTTETETETETITETLTDTSISSNEDKKRKRFVAPTIDEVRDYCNENGYRIDAEAFVDHYQSVGWKVGSKPMRDWKAAVRTWVRRDKERMPKKQTESSFDDTFMLTALKRVYGEAGA